MARYRIGKGRQIQHGRDRRFPSLRELTASDVGRFPASDLAAWEADGTIERLPDPVKPEPMPDDAGAAAHPSDGPSKPPLVRDLPAHLASLDADAVAALRAVDKRPSAAKYYRARLAELSA